MMVLSLIIGFVFTPLDSTHVYIEANGYASLRFELQNNAFMNATYNLVIKRLSAPSDLSFDMCFNGSCHAGDSSAIEVEAGASDTITLDIIGGNNTGPFDIFYLVYDQNAQNDRDSVEITGGVPVLEKRQKEDIYSIGDYIYGDGLLSARVLTKDGRLLGTLYPKNSRIYTGGLRHGVYFLIIKTTHGKKAIKIYRRQ